jgi:hypothetical protein
MNSNSALRRFSRSTRQRWFKEQSEGSSVAHGIGASQVTFTIQTDEKALHGDALDTPSNLAFKRRSDSNSHLRWIYSHPKVNCCLIAGRLQMDQKELDWGDLSPHFAGHAQKTLHQQVRARHSHRT